MGECVYYIKAKFSSCADMKSAAVRIRQFIGDVDLVSDMNRQRPFKDWLASVHKQFPEIYRALKWCDVDETKTFDFILGSLSYGAFHDVEENLMVGGRTICYSANVWHMAGWDLLEVYLRKRCKAIAVGWTSDEDLDPFDGVYMIPTKKGKKCR